MPPKSTPAQTEEKTIEFLLLCLENSGKVNFEQVAKQSTLVDNASKAYKRLWDMKRKFKEQQVRDGVVSSPSFDLGTPKKASKVTKRPKKKKGSSSEE